MMKVVELQICPQGIWLSSYSLNGTSSLAFCHVRVCKLYWRSYREAHNLNLDLTQEFRNPILAGWTRRTMRYASLRDARPLKDANPNIARNRTPFRRLDGRLCYTTDGVQYLRRNVARCAVYLVAAV